MTSVDNAQLEWDEEGQPISSQFGDIYFSKANGLAETRHVFLQHNQLSERFASLVENSHFTIAETGFGSGLNFLAAWELWLETAPKSAQLHFVSVEKFPLHKMDLTRALALWPELEHLSTELIDAYPTFVGIGFHRLQFMEGRIKLTLIIDDAAQGFSKLLASPHPLFAREGAKVDAWFLDGFAPSKNPHMWSEQLFNCISKLSHSSTTAATFSSAAIVKNGLKYAGFTLQKVAGFGRKREMLKAFFSEAPNKPNPVDFTYKGSFSPYPIPWTIQGNRPLYTHKEAVVIGGGLAGCSSARALADRGWQVTLVERHSELAQEGSGNPQGALYAKLSPLDEAQAAFNLSAYQFAIDAYRPHWPAIGDQCGLLQLAYKPAEQKLHQELYERFSQKNDLVQFVTALEASNIAGVSTNYSGLYFPQAGWINPKKLCEQLVKHPSIHIKKSTQAFELKRFNSSWDIVFTDGNSLNTSVVIIANAKDALDFEYTNHLPIKVIRGQVTYLPKSQTSPRLKSVICAEGYISPAVDSQFCTGATFNLKDDCKELRAADHQTNLNNLHDHLPAIAHCWNQADTAKLNGRVGFRCSLPDYLPVVGSAPDIAALDQDFAPLRKNARAGIITPGSYVDGLYINIGHGARGLVYTPLCAELLASIINHEPLPISQELANALNPARFIIRDLTRNKR